VNVVGILNIIFIVIRQIDIQETADYIKTWIIVQMVINFLFLLELLSDFFIHGPIKAYK